MHKHMRTHRETDAGKCWPLPFPVGADDATAATNCAADIG